MNQTTRARKGIRRRILLGLPAAMIAAAAVGSPAVAATQTSGGGAIQPTSTQAMPGPTSQGIIMRDGGVCDPIRHMGC